MCRFRVHTKTERFLQTLKTWTTTRALKHFKSVPPPLPPPAIIFNDESLQEEFYNAFLSTRGSRAFKELISRGELPWFVRKGQYLKGTLQV
ncbi:hypothetical protein CEXT_517051 [Caerostris extrusa]|uniref:Uncharacterized protein n=1 Tax=Caerostris extrusa TaxID=172846 RepID=A0AAV4XC79_CAEEX|nr:hypothetical protein CEXT_517051 [Caerostris extrusa]